MFQRYYAKQKCIIFGGKVIVLGGDFSQILPVLVHGSSAKIVSSSSKLSYIIAQIMLLYNLINLNQMHILPSEYLNSITLSGITQQKLTLKVVAVIMLMRNLNP